MRIVPAWPLIAAGVLKEALNRPRTPDAGSWRSGFQRFNNLMHGRHRRPAVRDFSNGQKRSQRDLFPLRLDRLRLAADVAARVSGMTMGDGSVSYAMRPCCRSRFQELMDAWVLETWGER